MGGEKPRGWWEEHGIDVLTMILTLVGLWIAYKIPISLNDQDSAERLKSERSARFEADLGQINQLVAGVLGEEGSDHAEPKRAAARAALEYAQQGRIYTPATSILLHYLEKESDVKTHCYLHAAIDRGLNVKPPALGAGARSEEGTALDENTWSKLIKAERDKLALLQRSTDFGECGAIPESTQVPIPEQSKISEFSQYLDVDCQRVNSNGALLIPLDSSLSANFKVQSATATIQDTSNLKEARASVVQTQPEGAVVQYSIVGLDRQLFGNCRGGGHGTLVVRLQLARK